MILRPLPLCAVTFTLLLLIVGIGTAAPSLSTVPAGGTVFVGEENLDVSACVGTNATTKVVWYHSGDTPGVTSPALTVTINPLAFYVSPTDFADRAGNWYLEGSTTVAFVVATPTMSIKVWDAVAKEDITGKSVVAGSRIDFRIETNLYTIRDRSPTDTFPFKVKVATESGTTLTSLSTAAGTRSLLDIPVSSNLYYWASNDPDTAWLTSAVDAQGNKVYKSGTYRVSAECNVNSIKDNYPETGKTATVAREVTLATDTLKIDASTKTVTRGNQFSVTVTGRPSTEYYVWVEGTGSQSGKPADSEMAPLLLTDQDKVAQDAVTGPYPIGEYIIEGGGGKLLYNDVPQYSDGSTISKARYYARVTTDSSGIATVGFQTSKETKEKKYTIRVENKFGANYKSDEVTVNVATGKISLDLSGTGSYYLGEEIEITGTNTESDTTFFFVTGPNLPSGGGKITDPRAAVVNGDESTFDTADVMEDKSYEFTWQTSLIAVDAGTYTVYAVSKPRNRDGLSDVEYETASVTVKKPYVTATMAQRTVARGDKVYITGKAGSQPTDGVAIWILGKNYALYEIEEVEDDATFSFEVTSGVTGSLANGQYYVVVQHPMYNDRFDVYPNGDRTKVLGLYPVDGNILFTIRGSNALQGSDAAEALVQAIQNPAVDDQYTSLQFTVDEPTININPIGTVGIGVNVTVKGETNLRAGDEMIIETVSSSFSPTDKTTSGDFSGYSGTCTVQKGSGAMNTFSLTFNTANFKKDEYILTASGITVDTSSSITFLVNPGAATPTPTETPTTPAATPTVNMTQNVTPPPTPPTTIPTPPPTTIPTPPPTPIPTVPTTIPTAPPTQESPGFGSIVALAGLSLVGFLVIKRD